MVAKTDLMSKETQSQPDTAELDSKKLEKRVAFDNSVDPTPETQHEENLEQKQPSNPIDVDFGNSQVNIDYE